jgi:uncharacterized repeat protein (TIGR03803 family)
MQASNGNFYGTTEGGGNYNNGVVFEMSPAGVFTDLFDFDPNTDGAQPFSALIEVRTESCTVPRYMGEPTTLARFIPFL